MFDKNNLRIILNGGQCSDLIERFFGENPEHRPLEHTRISNHSFDDVARLKSDVPRGYRNPITGEYFFTGLTGKLSGLHDVEFLYVNTERRCVNVYDLRGKPVPTFGISNKNFKELLDLM